MKTLAEPGVFFRRLAGLSLPGLLALGSFWCCAEQKRKPKPPEVEVVQVIAHRSEGLLTFDGRVRNSGERAVPGLILIFDLLAPGREVLTSQRGALEEELLAPGAEAEFHWQMRDPVRAVSFRIHAEDASGNDLTVRKPGPYPVE